MNPDTKKWLVLIGIMAVLWFANRNLAPPGPDVQPTPPNVATDPAAFVLTIRKSSETPVDVTKLLNDPYWDELRAKGISVIHYDYADNAVSSYKTTVDQLGLPSLFAIKKDGTPLLKVKLPATISEVKQMLGPFSARVSAASSSAETRRQQSSARQTPSENFWMAAAA